MGYVAKICKEKIQMINLKKDLQAVKKELNTLSKKVDKLIAAAGKPEKQKPTKKAMTKKPTSKTAKKLSAADTVFGFIKKSRSGINIQKLKEKTGFQSQKLHNAVYTLKKQGKIKSEKKGFYIKA
jgi:predicted Rossmann fold nucleotide-binding protein DprA/Smf involved in DNA uptake